MKANQYNLKNMFNKKKILQLKTNLLKNFIYLKSEFKKCIDNKAETGSGANESAPKKKEEKNKDKIYYIYI